MFYVKVHIQFKNAYFGLKSVDLFFTILYRNVNLLSIITLMRPMCTKGVIVRFFRGVSGGIVVLHSSLSSFVASTRLIWSGVGAIDSPD